MQDIFSPGISSQDIFSPQNQSARIKFICKFSQLLKYWFEAKKYHIMLEQLKMLRAKRAFPRKQALAIQPTEIFFDKGEKKAYFRLEGPKIS